MDGSLVDEMRSGCSIFAPFTDLSSSLATFLIDMVDDSAASTFGDLSNSSLDFFLEMGFSNDSSFSLTFPLVPSGLNKLVPFSDDLWSVGIESLILATLQIIVGFIWFHQFQNGISILGLSLA